MGLASLFIRLPLWLLVLVLVIIFPFFFIGGPSYYSTSLFHKLWDCGHIIFFMGIVVSINTKIRLTGWRAFVLVSVAAFLLGGAIEIIQSHIGRDGNWQDLINDMASAWLGFFCIQNSSRLMWVGRLASIGLLARPLSLVFLAAWSQFQVEKSFPIIADFESSIALHGWKGNIERTTLFHSNGNYSLKIHLTTKKYSGVSLTEFYNSWQNFTSLSLDIYNPAQLPIDLTIRVSDVRHELGPNDQSDRFNKKLHLDTGWNHIEIPVAEIRQAPATRELEMDSITSMIIFATQLPTAQDIYLDNIRLQ